MYGTDGSVVKSAGLGTDTTLTPGGGAGNPNFELQEAFLTYKCPITSLQLKFGKFATPQGLEVIESKDNVSISRGFLFGLAEAYTHTGALIGYTFPKYIDFWVGAVNGWDLYTDNNTGKSLLAKVGINPCDKISGSVSIIHGPEQASNTNNARTNIDTTWVFKPCPKSSVGLQFLAGQEDNAVGATAGAGKAHWYGATVQPKYDITDKFNIGARYEWLQDSHGARTGAGVSNILQNATLTPGVNLTENLVARVELRYDWSSLNNQFQDQNGLTQSHQTTIGTEFVYKF
jgi:hypothetical protein